MRIEGDCPECESKVGVMVADAQAQLFGSAIRRYLDKDGNGVWCQDCEEYIEPDNNKVHE